MLAVDPLRESRSLDAMVGELMEVRAKGLDRFSSIEAPTLRSVLGELTGHEPTDLQVHHLEMGLGMGVQAMGSGDAADCAAILFGLASHVLGLHPRELRKLAAEFHYDRAPDQGAVDAFRKTREPRVVASLATAMLRVCETGTTDVPPPGGLRSDVKAFPAARLIVDVPGWRQRTLPVLQVEPERPGQLRELTWDQFGQGMATLRDQIHHYGTNLDIDLAIGINEAGLMMATLLASASFSRCAIGYIRTRSKGTSMRIDEQYSLLTSDLADATAVVICDYEVKTTHVLSRVCEYLYSAGLPEETPRYFAVMGALATEEPSLDALDDLDVAVPLSRLVCNPVLQAAHLADAFIGCLMPRPGIDPPLGLR